MTNESGMVDGEYATALLTLVLAHVVDTLVLHPEIPNVVWLSQRLLEEWYDGEMTPLGKAAMSHQLAEAAMSIVHTASSANRIDAIRHCAKSFSIDFHAA